MRITEAGVIMFSDLKLYFKTIVPQIGWYWHKNRQEHMSMEQSLEIKPCIYGQIIYDKRAKNIQWGKDNLFNKWWWESWTAVYKRAKLFCLIPQAKNSQKCSKTWM